jgi:hypothetical protein
MRCIHLFPENKRNSIHRSGIRGSRIKLLTADGPLELRSGVYSMPVLKDNQHTFQWLRELKRWHQQRMLAAVFLIPDEAEVWVGHFGDVHQLLPAKQAAGWMLGRTQGTEMIIPRSISQGELACIRELDQRVGWTEHPEHQVCSVHCVCSACLPAGLPDLFRRLRAAYYNAIARLRAAQNLDEQLEALGQMEAPLERVGKRLSPKRILSQAKNLEPAVRSSLARLLGLFHWRDVGPVVLELLDDCDDRVSLEALHAFWKLRGSLQCAQRLVEHRLSSQLLEILEWEDDSTQLCLALEHLRNSSFPGVRDGAWRRLESLEDSHAISTRPG